MPDPTPTPHHPWPRPWLVAGLVLFALGYLIQLRYLVFWMAQGGNPWTQGDWLINLAAGQVRRGLLGEGLIRLAQVSGLPVLVVLDTLQIGLSLALYGLAAGLVFRQSSPAALLAVFSGAFFVVFIGAFPSSGLRKEMLGYLALLLLACPGGGLGRLAGSAALLVACAAGHEVGVLFLPAWLAGLWLLRRDLLASVRARAVILVTLALVLAAGLHALAYARVPDTEPICDAIRAAGPVSETFCSGAVGWLERTESGPAQVARALAAHSPGLALTLLAFGAAGLPLLRLLRLCRTPGRIRLALVLAVAPFLVLFPLGFDWGRWVSIQYTVAAVLVLGLMQREELVPAARPWSGELLLWLGLAMASGLNLSLELYPFNFPGIALIAVTGRF